MLDSGSPLEGQNTRSWLLVGSLDSESSYSRGCPAHEGVLPALAVIELDLPGVDVVRAALHGILGRNMDADAAFLEMLFGDTGYGAKIDGRGHRDLAAQLVALLQLIGTGQGQLGVQWTAVR